MDKTTIIVVEDNIVYCEFVCNMLAREGYRTVKAYHTSQPRRNIYNRRQIMTSWVPTCACLTVTALTFCAGCERRERCIPSSL